MTKIAITPSRLNISRPIALNESSQIVIDWWDDHLMLDDLDYAQVLADHDRTMAAAERLNITTLQSLHDNAARVIAEATGVASLTRFTDPDTSDALHRIRNAIAATLFAVESRHGSEPDPHGCIARLPAVAPRSGSKRRALRDDEIVLTRAEATHGLALGGRFRIPAIQYALAESGARPMETTSVTPLDFDDPRDPAAVDLPGVNGRAAARTVHLGAWAANLLRRGLAMHLGANSRGEAIPICWTGLSGKGSASASSSNNLKHVMERVGINAPSLEGSAATRWRVRNELRAYGDAAALQLLGQYDPDNPKIYRVYDFIDEARPSTYHRPQPAAKRSFKGL